MQRLRLRTFVDVHATEVGALLLSATYCFVLLFSYSILRPLRDAWGIEGGTDNLPWLFMATFVTMLAVSPVYGAVVARGKRRAIVPTVYRFFALNLLAFYALLQFGVAHVAVGYAYFVWISVYNLFVVAIFWSFMADLFSNEQGKRLFGFIAVGGTLGALAGAQFTKQLAETLGRANLLLLSAGLLEVCTQCVGWLLRYCESRPGAAKGGVEGERAGDKEARVGGGILDGFRLVFAERYMLGVAAQILCLTMTATFLYLLKARIVHASVQGTEARTAAFASIDVTVNALELALQICVTAPLLRRAGLARTLRVLPVVTAAVSVILSLQPTMLALQVCEGVRRAVQYAVFRPARELLFTVVDRERKYATKGFIDTVVYRGGDLASSQIFAGLEFLGLKTAGLALAGLPIAGGWYALSGYLARRQQQLASEQESAAPRLPELSP
jgi:ATP:ADP antiporter, AAA family